MKNAKLHFTLNATVAALLCIASGPIWAGTEGSSSTFYGVGAGAFGTGNSGDNTSIGRYAGYNSSSGIKNTFIGFSAGASNIGGNANSFLGWNAGRITTGGFNTFVGTAAGYGNTSGSSNVFVGTDTGETNTTGSNNTSVGNMAGFSNSTGSRNVFLGNQAGLSETGSDKLYIDNCFTGGGCTSPFIYGEFANHLLRINGEVGVAANGVAKSQLHFSQSGTDVGGWLTSVADNNFFMSSGAKYDAAAGGWIQKSSDGKAVMAGSGASGYRVYTSLMSAGTTTLAPVSRLHIDYSGNFGVNTPAVAGQPITTGTGAVLSAGGAWLNASSRDRKENIQELSAADAQQTLAMLNPVSFNYKVDGQEKHVGFIAEDVPEMVASKDRKSLSALDIVAVLTKVVQEQKQMLQEQKNTLEQQKQTLEEKSRAIEEQKKSIDAQQEALLSLAAGMNERFARLTTEVQRLRTLSLSAQR